jgi:hypothetical protein
VAVLGCGFLSHLDSPVVTKCQKPPLSNRPKMFHWC